MFKQTLHSRPKWRSLQVLSCALFMLPFANMVFPEQSVHAESGRNEGAFSPPRLHYLLNCAGCHGLEGHSSKTLVPDLLDQAGFFLCSPEGRDYIIRLPNVAFVKLPSQQLADLMNYVVFTLGKGSVPTGAKPYTAAEVDNLRKRSFHDYSLQAYRKAVVESVLRACPAAVGKLQVYGTALDQKEVANMGGNSPSY